MGPVVEIDGVLDSFLYNCHIERLWNEIRNAEIKRLLFLTGFKIAGNAYHRDFINVAIVVHIIQNLIAVHFRHDHIQQNNGQAKPVPGD